MRLFGRLARAGMCMQIALNSSLFLLLFRCYECDEELSTHCNKKVLAQIVDFLQKHGARAEPSKFAQTVLSGDTCNVLSLKISISDFESR